MVRYHPGHVLVERAQRRSCGAELSGTIVQLWVQLSVIWTPRVGVGDVTWVENCEPANRPVPSRATVMVGRSTGMLMEGVTALRVCAVPMEIVACEGTNSGSVSVLARLKKICRLVSELSEEARSSAVL